MAKGRRIVIVIGIVLIVLALSYWLFTYAFFSNNTQNGTSGQPAPTLPDTPQKNTIECINGLPDSVKIAQKIMVAVYNDQLSNEIPVLANVGIGGVIIMNATTESQISNLRNVLNIVPFIAVDQEGGSIQRYTVEGLVPGAADMAANFSTDQAYNKYLEDGR